MHNFQISDWLWKAKTSRKLVRVEWVANWEIVSCPQERTREENWYLCRMRTGF